MCVSHGRCTAEPISRPSGYFTAGLRGVCERACGFIMGKAAFEGVTGMKQGETVYTVLAVVVSCMEGNIASIGLARGPSSNVVMSCIASLRSRVSRPLSCAGGKCTRAPRTSRVLECCLSLAGCPSSTATYHRRDHQAEHRCSPSHLTSCRPTSMHRSLRPSWAW